MGKPTNWPKEIPYIDTNVAHVGVSAMRRWSSHDLKNTSYTFVIQDGGEPIAVLMSYEAFLAIQKLIQEKNNG